MADITRVMVRRQKTVEEIHAEKVAAYWSLFLLMNANPKPLDDGSYYLGEIGATKSDRGVSRATPYSPGRIK